MSILDLQTDAAIRAFGAPAATSAGTSAATSAALADGLRVASHEIRQPVAAVLALAEASRLHPETTPDLQSYLERIIDQATQIADTARSVLEVEHLREPQRIAFDVEEILEGVLETFRLTWDGTLVRQGRAGVLAVGDPALLRRSLINVLENATRAAGLDGTVCITVTRRDGYVVVEVQDDGPGFGNIASGSRLGLALTRRALTGMGGSLQVGSSPETGGARVLLTVPLLRGMRRRRVAAPHYLPLGEESDHAARAL